MMTLAQFLAETDLPVVSVSAPRRGKNGKATAVVVVEVDGIRIPVVVVVTQ